MVLALSSIDGVISKKLELEGYLNDMYAQIVCLTDTTLTNDDGFEINIYDEWRRGRDEGNGGGVMITVRSEVKVLKEECEQGTKEVVKVRNTGKKKGVESQGNGGMCSWN